MVSVTQRIKNIKQPRGGYVPLKRFQELPLGEAISLNAEESLHPSLMGLVVDNMLRFYLEGNKREAFHIVFLGASLIGELEEAEALLEQVVDLEAPSLQAASQLVGYDCVFRAGIKFYKPVEEIYAHPPTCKNIKNMVLLLAEFLSSQGKLLCSGATFLGGYTDIISTGDCDFITEETLWDLKVSVKPPTKDHILQILIYYLMVKRSIHKNLHAISKIGILNPRLNKAYLCAVSEVNPEIIKEIEEKVIGY